jgi:cobalt-zinc-cadmium efflux system outer membrane protein
MRTVRVTSLGALALAISVGGCVSVPRDFGWSDVTKTVTERTGQTVQWNDHGAIVPASDTAVAAMLHGKLTAERAVEIAFANNRDLQATLEELGIARAELLQASLIRNPVFDAELRFPGSPAKPFELSVTQTLLDLIQLPSRRKLGAAMFAATKTRISGAVINFAADVRGDFYELQATQQVLARQNTITEAAGISAEIAIRQHDAGNISDLDLENEQAVYEQAKLDLARSQLAALATRERLVMDMGLTKNDSNWTVQTEFAAIPETETPVDDLESTALSRRVDIALARAQLEAAKKALPIAQVSAFGDLSAGLHHDRDVDGSKTTGPALSVPIPIFNRGAAARSRAEAILRQSQQRLEALLTNARSEVRAAHERLIEARSRAQYLRDIVVPRRQRIVSLTQLDYNSMHRGVFELIRARQNLAGAERELVLAQRDYWMARTEMDRALDGGASFSIRQEMTSMSRTDLNMPMNVPRPHAAHQ